MKLKILITFLCILLVDASNLAAISAASCRIMITGGRTTVCLGQPLVLIANTHLLPDEISDINWYRNGESLPDANQKHVRLNTSTPDSANILLKIIDVYGTATQCSVRVVIIPTPSVVVSKHYSLFQRLFIRNPNPTLRAKIDQNFTIQWFRNDIEIPGANRNRLRANEHGSYRARVKCTAGCLGFGEIIIVE